MNAHLAAYISYKVKQLVGQSQGNVQYIGCDHKVRFSVGQMSLSRLFLLQPNEHNKTLLSFRPQCCALCQSTLILATELATHSEMYVCDVRTVTSTQWEDRERVNTPHKVHVGDNSNFCDYTHVGTKWLPKWLAENTTAKDSKLNEPECAASHLRSGAKDHLSNHSRSTYTSTTKPSVMMKTKVKKEITLLHIKHCCKFCICKRDSSRVRSHQQYS